jgi:hypothetical protein
MKNATAASPKCSKCSGEMEAGFLLDRSQAGIYRAVWATGPIQRSWWFGGIKVQDKPMYRVETWRCKACGNLESWAKRQVGLYES